MTNPSSTRLYYLDWVRVIAFTLLIIFHCAMPFVTMGWEIKNQDQSRVLSSVILWLHQWRLPLLFFIAGVGSYYSIARRSALKFMGERFVRLFIPLWFGMLFITPLQVYYEWMQEGKINMSYPDFYPSVWSFVPYPDGTLTWSHLWFVAYLFVFTVMLWPVFALLKVKAIDELKKRTNNLFTSPVVVFLMVTPLTWLFLSLYIRWPEQGSLLGDWFLFDKSILLFFFGFWFANLPAFWDTCEKYRQSWLTIAIISMSVLFVTHWSDVRLPKEQNGDMYLYGVFDSVHIWTMILAMIGYAKHHLNFNSPKLRYFTQAVYPYYILHQTVIVATGYYIVQWNLPIVVKMPLLIVVCVASVLLIYHYLIRPFMMTRVLFGVKPKESKTVPTV